MPIPNKVDPGLAVGGPPTFAGWRQTAIALTQGYLDLYTASVSRIAEAHIATARATKLPALLPLAESHAAITRECAEAYAAAVRGFLDG
jgi:hypothetical protein